MISEFLRSRLWSRDRNCEHASGALEYVHGVLQTFSEPIFGHSTGSTKLDRLHCKSFWVKCLLKLWSGGSREPFSPQILSWLPDWKNPLPIARHLSHDPCQTVFSMASQTPPLLSLEVAYRSAKTGFGGGGIAAKACLWKAYRDTGGIARNSITSALLRDTQDLSGLPNANAKSQRFSYATSQIAPLRPVAALNRSFKSQIAARYAAFWHAISQIALTSFL